MDFLSSGMFLVWGLCLLYFFVWIVIQIRKNRLMTVNTTTVVMQIFIPLVVIYPFTFSTKNMSSTGIWYFQYVGFVNNAFLISMVGALAYVFGYILVNQRSHTKSSLLTFADTAISSLSTGSALTLLMLVEGIIFLTLLKFHFFGVLGGMRAFGMQHHVLMPLVNLLMALIPLQITLSLWAYRANRKTFIGLYLLFGMLLGLLTGTRTAVFSGILIFIFVTYNIRSLTHRLRLGRIVVAGLVLVLLAVYVGELRQQHFSPLYALSHLSHSVLYGNNFSDLRDFAWVLSGWNHQLLWGKTELSGILSFIPSSVFPFRANWGIGVFTARTAGLDPRFMPGLRPGIFGEAYFNFGLVGVFCFGVLYGNLIGRLNRFAFRAPDHGRLSSVLTAYLVANQLSNIMITASFESVYIFIFLLVFGYLFMRIKNKLGVNSKRYVLLKDSAIPN